MADTTKAWKPSHPDVVHRLLDNLDKLGTKAVDYLTEVRISLGQGLVNQLDLVVMSGYRTRAGKRGKVMTLYEVKTEPSGLFRIILGALQQLSMYHLALNHPALYVIGEDKIEKLSDSLGYRQYVVIQEALWGETEELSEDELEKLSELLVLRNVGVVTYDSRWRFRLDKFFGKPDEEQTDWLANTAKRQRSK